MKIAYADFQSDPTIVVVQTMRVWLLTVGEPLPTDSGVDRAWRTGLLAQQLITRGHEVVWWSSSFDHFRRRKRSHPDVAIAVSPEFTVWHLDGVPYGRSVSLARIRNHRGVAQRFRRLAQGQPRPDVILSSLPTLELCCAAVDFGTANAVPVALDIRDLWPDVAVELAPRALQGVARRALWWMTRQLLYATKRADAILGLTDEFVRWGLTGAGRDRTSRDQVFPMAYAVQNPTKADLTRADMLWDARGLSADAGRFIVCFFGVIGPMCDFATVIGAAKRLAAVAPEVTFVLCGAGDRLEAVREQARGLSNIVLPGRVSALEVHALMRRSAVGLVPYRPFRNYEDNLPNKPIEYLSAGLPIVATRLKVLARLLATHKCGLTYDHGDVAGLTSAVQTLTRDGGLQLSMAKRAESLYCKEYVAERVYERMAVHLEGLASTGMR